MQNKQRFWIAFGDIHEHTKAVARIEHLDQAEAVLVSGDLTNIGGASEADQVLQSIAQHNPRIYAQIGNMDTVPVDELLTQRGINVHARVLDLGLGVGLAAVGYSNPTPFKTPSEVPDEQLGEWSRQVLSEAADFDRVIFMVHTPPLNTTLDQLTSGVSVGSAGVRAAIEEFQPDIVITGHIHEAAGQDILGRSVLFNPGALADGGYVRITEDASGLQGHLEYVS